MNLIKTLKSKLHSKKRTALLSGLLMLSGSFLDASLLPVPLGPPERISPIPGPENPDPILQNLVAVMDDHYQPPFYPGGNPDYLSQIYLFSDFYIMNFIKFNPCNDKIMLAPVGQNVILDLTGFYGSNARNSTIGSNTLAKSVDRGRSWRYTAPIEQIIPLGGNISQIINASLGPGLYFTYGKNGRLYAAGWGFFDMTPQNPLSPQIPQSGFIFTTSDDNGKTFTPKKIELASNTNAFYFPASFGVGEREFYITPEPSNPDLIHASSMFVLQRANEFGTVFYTKSTNGGKSFAPLRQVYNIIDDPVWHAKFFNPNDPRRDYFAYGGWALSSWLPVKYDDNILFLPVSRRFRTANDLLPFGISDQALVRSLDNGETWERVAGATETFVGPIAAYDPGFVNPIAGQIVNGFLTFPFFFDGPAQPSLPQVSPSTGRIYLTYGATNVPISNFTTFATTNHLLLSSSSDKGKTFTPPVQINQTPTNIQPGAQQVLAPATALTSDGYYVVGYYDFRNWTGFPGEDVTTTPLQTDAWLDVYRETEDPRGGSTGVGLDFVGEIRLTPESFNARIVMLSTPRPYISPWVTGTPEGLALTVNNNNELFVVFSMQTGEGVSPANITLGYRGMTIDTNSYMTDFLQRFKFANDSNQ